MKHEIPESGNLKVGSSVRVKPRVGARFKGTITRILADDAGDVVEVEVMQTGNYPKFRTVLPASVKA
jgi:hypothetical protein